MIFASTSRKRAQIYYPGKASLSFSSFTIQCGVVCSESVMIICFFREWSIARQLKKIKGLAYAVHHASSLNVSSLKFGTCKTKYSDEQEFIQLVAVYSVAFLRHGSVLQTYIWTSVYGVDSLLALDLLAVYLCRLYKYMHARINEAPADVWNVYIYVSEDLACAVHLKFWLSSCLRRWEVTARENTPDLIWREVLIL